MSRPELVAEELQRAIRHVVDDYNAFVVRGPVPGTHDDAKAFAAHHAAAKAALTHLEHLMKLARAACASGEEQGMAHAVALLRQARGALADASLEAEEESDTDDGAAG